MARTQTNTVVGLCENVSQRLTYLNIWCQVGGTIWGKFSRCGIVVGITSPAPGTGFESLRICTISDSFCLWFEDVSSHLAPPATMPAASCHVSLPSWALELEDQTNSLL